MMTLSRFSSLPPQAKACHALAAQQRGTQAGIGLHLVGWSSLRLGLPQAKGGTQPHDQQGKVTMHHHRSLDFLGELPQMPGMLALFEDAVLNHGAPVVGIKDDKGIADRAIGQVDRAIGGRHPIIEASYDDGVAGLAFVVAPMSVTLVCSGSP